MFKIGDRVEIVNVWGWEGIRATVTAVNGTVGETQVHVRLTPDVGSRYARTGKLLPAKYKDDIGFWRAENVKLIKGLRYFSADGTTSIHENKLEDIVEALAETQGRIRLQRINRGNLTHRVYINDELAGWIER